MVCNPLQWSWCGAYYFGPLLSLRKVCIRPMIGMPQCVLQPSWDSTSSHVAWPSIFSIGFFVHLTNLDVIACSRVFAPLISGHSRMLQASSDKVRKPRTTVTRSDMGPNRKGPNMLGPLLLYLLLGPLLHLGKTTKPSCLS